MQWDTSAYAGFTNASKPWLPINDNYKDGVNVKDQAGVDVDSHLNVFKQLTLLRSTYNFSSTVLYSTKEVNISLSITKHEKVSVLFSVKYEYQ